MHNSQWKSFNTLMAMDSASYEKFIFSLVDNNATLKTKRPNTFSFLSGLVNTRRNTGKALTDGQKNWIRKTLMTYADDIWPVVEIQSASADEIAEMNRKGVF